MRAELVDGVLGLGVEEQRTTRLPSGWTPIELLSHVLHMEQRWFVWGFLDEPWDSEAEGRWHVAEDVTAEELDERLGAVAARTRAVLAEHPLTATASPGGRFADDPPTLEWICFHVLAEYARHAGHLDIAVELAQPLRDR